VLGKMAPLTEKRDRGLSKPDALAGKQVPRQVRKVGIVLASHPTPTINKGQVAHESR